MANLNINITLNGGVENYRFSGKAKAFQGVTASTSTGWSGIIYTCPYIVGTPHTVTGINIDTTTNNPGQTLRLALYRDNNGEIGTLVEESGLIDCSSSGAKTYNFAAPISLTDKLYWLAAQTSNSAVGYRFWSALPQIVQRSAGSGAAASFIKTQAYGAFPSPFNSTTTTSLAPLLQLIIQ